MRTQQIKKALLQRRGQLLARYHGELARANEEVDARDSEVVENATELWDVRLLSRMSEVDAAMLGRIVAALRRLEDGCYGSCLVCGTAIAAPRLEALPEAGTCYACESDAERATA